MTIKFEVGKVYYSKEVGYARDGNTLKDFKRYWLCVKRNDSTGYVSFSRIYKGHVLSSVDSRKVRLTSNDWSAKHIVKIEEISIGYGGEGAWRNHHIIRADQVKE